MEDFIGLILVAIFYILSASSKKKKKEKKRRKAQQFEEIGREFKKAIQDAEMRNAQEQKQAPAAKDTHIPAAARAVHAEETAPALCESDRLHLHQVTQAQMEEAQEGEDPCHKGGNTQEQAEIELSYEADAAAEGSGLAQDLLRGVIVSEILTRPDQRRAMLKNRWRA